MFTFETFVLDTTQKNYIETLIKHKKLKILVSGETETGKTLFSNCIIENFFDKEHYTIFKVEQFHDIGINYFRQDVRHFCKYTTPKQKVIVIDNVDYIKECSQFIIKSIIEEYPNILYIFTCKNIRKVYKPIVNQLFTIQLNQLIPNEMKHIMNLYCQKVDLVIEENLKSYIVKTYYNGLPSTILNILKTLTLLKGTPTKLLVDTISSTINNSIFNNYFSLIKKGDLEQAIKTLVNTSLCYVSLIDLFECLYNYTKNHIDIKNEKETPIIKLVAKYKLFINVSQEKNIEIYFLTYDIYNEMQKHKDDPRFDEFYNFDKSGML